MRLLHRQADGRITLTKRYLRDADIPRYGILSHCWLSEWDEVRYEDIVDGSIPESKPGYDKIRFCSQQAAKDDLDYFWIDAVCINRGSSQELQEAITTMYHWYRRAVRCYVYMVDVSVEENGLESGNWETAFRQSRWFTRGWTLQELLAPQ